LVRRSGFVASIVALAMSVTSAHAQDATWVGGGATPNEWVEDDNWTPATVPTGTATFDVSAVTAVQSNGIVNVNAVDFTAGSSTYTITTNDFFLVHGTGVTNNNLVATQTFDITSSLVFFNSSSASTGPGAVVYNNSGAISFLDTSTAGSATVNNNGDVEFNNSSTAGSATITNNGVINFQDSSSATTATITNNASGTITFNTTSTAGSATITNAGALSFNNSSTAGTSTITNNAGGTIAFTVSGTAGAANITNNVGGTIAFSDTSTGGTATIGNSGDITFGISSTAGGANITNNAAATLTFNDTSSAGGATIINTGAITFNNSSTAGGAALQNNIAATLTFNDTSSAGTATIGATVNSTITFNSASTAASANIGLNGASVLTFNNSSSAGSATIVSNSTSTTISFNNTSTAGNAGITNNAFLFFNDTSTAGNSTITNNGAMSFLNASSAGSAAIVNNGGGSLLSFSDTSSAGNATITTNAGALTQFTTNSTGDTARFITNAGGTFDMSGLASGGMTAGSIEGAGNYFLGGNALTVGSNNLSTTVSGVISDGGVSGGVGGSLTKVGAGTLTLSGTDTYTGATTINGGTLLVTGSIATSSSVTVNAGATLAGTGTVSSTVVNSGGTLAPGNNAIGTLNVAGNVTFNSGSTFTVMVSPSTSSKLVATGTATLAGTVQAVFQPGSYISNSYTILIANGGRSGTFDSLTTVNLPAFLTASLAYTPTDVLLMTLHSQINRPGLAGNQSAVAIALDNAFNSGQGTLSGLATVAPGQIPAALNALSGEGTSGTQETAFGAGGLFITAMMEQGAFWNTGGGVDTSGVTYGAMNYAPISRQAPVFKAMPPTAPPVETQRYRAWFAGFDGNWHLNGLTDPGSANLTHNTAGGAAGFDYVVNPHFLVGVAAGGSTSTFSVPDRATSGSLDGAHIGAYGVGRWGPWYAAGALAFSAFDNKTSRVIAGVGPTEVATGSFNSDMLSGRFELGYKQAFRGFTITPFAAVQFSELWQAGYSETSTTAAGAPGVLGLTFASRTISSLPTFLGAQFDTRIALDNGMIWSPYARVSWVHEFEPSRDVTATFITLPAAGFTVDGARAARDAARIDLGSKLAIARNAWLFGTFDGEFSDRSRMYAGRGGIKFTW
jgi:outer membrane autotransporter protein